MGKRIGDYYVDKKIGSGAFGKVKIGTNLNTNEVFAIKVVNLEGQKPRLRELIEQEIILLRSCDHSHVIKLFDVLKSKRNYYLVMEYCEGGDLSNAEAIPEHITKKWATQLINALIYLKGKSIIHRDLKPANLLLTNENYELADIKIADFGFSRILNENCLASTLLGTPLFMAPEVLRGDSYDYKADVWSLGAVIYEILFGKPAFDCTTRVDLMKLQTKPINFPSNIPVSDDAKNFIMTMMTYNPKQRTNLENLLAHPFLDDDDLPDIASSIVPPYLNSVDIITEVVDTERSFYEDEEEEEAAEEAAEKAADEAAEMEEYVECSNSSGGFSTSSKKSFGLEPLIQAAEIDFEAEQINAYEKLIEDFEEEDLPNLAFAVAKYAREKYEQHFKKIEKLKNKFQLPYNGNEKFYKVHKQLRAKVFKSRTKENNLTGFVCDYDEKIVAREIMEKSLLISEHEPKLKSAMLLLQVSKAYDPQDEAIEQSFAVIQNLYQGSLI